MKESIDITGVLNIEVYEHDKLINTITTKNKIVDDAFKIVSSVMRGNSNSKISKLVIGDGGIESNVLKVVSSTDKDLYNRVRDDIPVTVYDNISTKTISYIALVKFGAGDNFIVNEAGLFNDYDVMFNKKTFTEFTVNENFYLNIKWDIIFDFTEA